MDLFMSCVKLGAFGFLVGHAVLLYVIYQLGRRYPSAVRSALRAVARLLLRPCDPCATASPASRADKSGPTE